MELTLGNSGDVSKPPSVCLHYRSVAYRRAKHGTPRFKCRGARRCHRACSCVFIKMCRFCLRCLSETIVTGYIPESSLRQIGRAPSGGKTTVAHQIMSPLARPEQRVPLATTTCGAASKLLRYKPVGCHISDRQTSISGGKVKPGIL